MAGGLKTRCFELVFLDAAQDQSRWEGIFGHFLGPVSANCREEFGWLPIINGNFDLKTNDVLETRCANETSPLIWFHDRSSLTPVMKGAVC